MTFWRGAQASFVTLAALALLGTIEAPRYRRQGDSPARRLLRTLHKDELNREARERETAGYYEGLLNEGSRVSAMNSLITGAKKFDWEECNRPGRRHRGDYRYWDLHPNITSRSDNPAFDLVTNSHGMADREYSREKPPYTWRVAVLGDSITRGQGAPVGRNYETLLEEALNSRHPGADRPRVEVLNFAVGGYRITQMVDVALEWAPPFQPDMFVVPFSELTVFKRWGDHITTLVQNGIDLKYDYLKRVVVEAGLRADDPAGTADAKLARFRLRTLDWAIDQIRSQASRQNASVVVLLLANGNDPEILEEEFAGVREMLAKQGVPVIDLLDAFADLDDPRRYRVGDNNLHPNEHGHRVLFEKLYARILADPTSFELFCGRKAGPAAAR